MGTPVFYVRRLGGGFGAVLDDKSAKEQKGVLQGKSGTPANKAEQGNDPAGSGVNPTGNA